MAKVVAPLAILVLVLSIARASGQCGFKNCTNFFQTCSTPADASRCICVPFGGAFGNCIYQGLIKDNLSYCSSHSDCVRKGQGDLCIKASGTDFGWCLSHDDAKSLKLSA